MRKEQMGEFWTSITVRKCPESLSVVDQKLRASNLSRSYQLWFFVMFSRLWSNTCTGDSCTNNDIIVQFKNRLFNHDWQWFITKTSSLLYVFFWLLVFVTNHAAGWSWAIKLSGWWDAWLSWWVDCVGYVRWWVGGWFHWIWGTIHLSWCCAVTTHWQYWIMGIPT